MSSTIRVADKPVRQDLPGNRTVRLGVLFSIAFASFLVVSAVVRFGIWHESHLSEGDPYTQKIDLARSQSTPIDILFTGASYIDVGIDPTTFDKEMASLGQPVRSFNLGIGGLGLVEMKDVIRSVIGRPNCCKYVLFSPAFSLWVIAMSSDNTRNIKYLDLKNAIREIVYMLSTPHEPNDGMQRYQYILNVLASTFRHYTNLGLASDLLGMTSFAQPQANWRTHPSWDDRGFTNIGERRNESREEYARTLQFMLTHRAAYMQRAKTGAQPADEKRIAPWMLNEIVRLGHEIEATGAIPLVLIPPKVSYWDWDTDFLVKFTQRCGTSHILYYGDPTPIPEVYDPGVRYDGGHLDGHGAELWSVLLAKDMAKVVAQGKTIGEFCKPTS